CSRDPNPRPPCSFMDKMMCWWPGSTANGWRKSLGNLVSRCMLLCFPGPPTVPTSPLRVPFISSAPLPSSSFWADFPPRKGEGDKGKISPRIKGPHFLEQGSLFLIAEPMGGFIFEKGLRNPHPACLILCIGIRYFCLPRPGLDISVGGISFSRLNKYRNSGNGE